MNMREITSLGTRVATTVSLLLSQAGSVGKFDHQPSPISDQQTLEHVDELELSIGFNVKLDPNDPMFPDQWNLQRPETHGTGWIDLYQRLRFNPPKTKEPVVIAIMDSGNNQLHPELQGILWENQGEVPNNGLDDDENGYPDDWNGCSFLQGNTNCTNLEDGTLTQHGTGTTGVLAALTDNEIGIAGTGSILPINIMPIKVIQGSGIANYSDITRGLQYAHTTQPDILLINIAGWPISAPTQANALLQQLHDDGVTIIAGTGNSFGTEIGIGWPANNPNVIAVGAYGKNGSRYHTSSVGPEIWISAPGEDIPTTCYDGTPEFDYCIQDGTSFAGPHVAGAAALIYMYRPDSTSEDIRELLQQSAGKTWTEDMGYGHLNFNHLANFLEIPQIHQVYLPFISK